MSMRRTRIRHDRFELRGWVYAYHQIRDQGLLAALVPEADNPRTIRLFSGQEVEIRKGDVAIIYPQIGWPMPGESATAPASKVEDALSRATEKVEAFKAAFATPPPPVSSADDNVVEAEFDEPELSHRLLAYRKQGESFSDFLSRLTPELMREQDKLNGLVLFGSGEARLSDVTLDPELSWDNNPMTVSERHGEISGLLAELQRLGAEAEARG